jgi:hypothetical protein
LDGKKEKLEDNSVKRAILTTFSATKAQKPLKRGYNYLYDKKKGKLFFTVFFSCAKKSCFITSAPGGGGGGTSKKRQWRRPLRLRRDTIDVLKTFDRVKK